MQIHLVLLPLRALRRAEAPVPARCSTSQVSGHVLVPSHRSGLFWHSEKLLSPLKEGNGRSEMRVQAFDFSSGI